MVSSVRRIPLHSLNLKSFFSKNIFRHDPSSQFRLAIGSYVESYSNAVQIVKKLPGGENFGNQLYQACEFDHPYPCTKILWSPDSGNMGGKDLLATTGDYLRIWNVTENDSTRGTLNSKKEALLNNVSFPFLIYWILRSCLIAVCL